MIEKAAADEKVEEGWLKIWLAFEVMAISKEKTKESLEELVNKLDGDKRVKVYKKNFLDIHKVDNPLKDIKEAYTLACEVELVVNNFDKIVQIVLEYGPSAVEILEPKKVSMQLGEAQSILNSISQMMHQFAAAGLGGIVFLGQKQ